MDAAEALTRLGGIATAAELLALTTRKRLRSAVSAGRVVHVSRGRYALVSPDEAESVAISLDGHLRLLSAAAHWGWKVKWPSRRPQVVIPTRPEQPVDANLLCAVLPRTELDGWATSRLRTVLDCATELPFDEALAVADSALRSGDLTSEQLIAALPSDATAAVCRVIEHASPLAANPFESVLRAILIDAGISVVPQWATTIGGITFHPDLADPMNGIAVEANSWAHHASKLDHDQDCVRYNALVLGGWLVLRFTWEQVMFSPHDVATAVRAAVALRQAA